jgi:MGT family glycosyltransferase
MWEGGGNVPPELGVARRLVARGHAVHVLGDPTIERGATEAGCTFSPWTRAPHHTTLDPMEDPIKDWETTNPLVLLRRFRDGFIAGPAGRFAADTADAIAEVRPDALLADAFLFGSVIAAQAASLPVVLLVSNIWIMPARGTPPMGPGFPPARSALGRGRDAALLAVVNRLFAKGLPALNRARAEHGLTPLSSFYDQGLAADRIVVLTDPEFDYAAPTVPGNVRYVGPILDDPEWARPWTPPWPADDGRPLVLVGFSTTYQNQGPVLSRVVEALSTLPVRAVVTLGQMLDAAEVGSGPSANVAVVASVPHQSVLAQASLVISHCGHGTTIKALAAGVPLVCIPMGRDQNDTAARVVEAGAGVRLRPTASAGRIGRAVAQVLADDRFRANAARLATAIHEGRRTADLVTEIEGATGASTVA